MTPVSFRTADIDFLNLMDRTVNSRLALLDCIPLPKWPNVEEATGPSNEQPRSEVLSSPLRVNGRRQREGDACFTLSMSIAAYPRYASHS